MILRLTIKMESDKSMACLNRILMNKMMFVEDKISTLKMVADYYQKEVKYDFDAVESPREAPVFRCTCRFLGYTIMTQGIGKKNPKQEAARQMLLLLSGDVETNPGPVQSRPVYYRYNDPRYTRLEKAIERRDDKIKTLIKELRRQIKNRKIYSQGMFDKLTKQISDGIKDGVGSEQMNGNLTRICDFLENTLPGLQANIQATVIDTTDKYVSLKEDIMKIVLVILLVRLLMVWKKYRASLCVILIFIFKFYGFDQKLIDLIMDLKNKIFSQGALEDTVEEVVYHPWFHTCGKIIFAVMAFLTIKKIPGKQDWDSYITRLDRIPKSIEGAKKITDYCSEYFNIANDQIKMMVLGKTKEELQRANGLYGEIQAWAQEVRQYLELDQRNKIDLDTETANRVEQLWIKGLKFKSEPLLSKEMSALVHTTLLPAKQLYEYVSCSPVKGGGPRMRPICLWLVGESGVGKTEMVYPLCIDVLREMGMIKKDDFHHQVYGRQVETEFWDGYKGQKIVIYDDAFQKKDDKTAANPEIFEVIRSCNTFPQHLHMAALHDKNTFSAAELLLYTTNDYNVKLESITFPDAFFNRMGDMAYKVSPKKEYGIETEKGNSGKTYLKLDKSKLDKTKAIDLSVYEFQKIVRDEKSDAGWIDSGSPLDYEDFAKLVCSKWKEAKQSSMNKLKFLEEYAIRAQVGSEENSEYGDCIDFVDDIAKRLQKGETLEEIEFDYASDPEMFTQYYHFKSTIKPASRWQKYKDRMDICLSDCKTYLAKKYEEIKKILAEHPILTILGMIGVALSALAMYYWFSKSLDPVEAEVAPSGDAKTVRLPRKLVEIGASGDVKTQKIVKPVVETEWHRNNKGEIEISCDECGMHRMSAFNNMTDEEFDNCTYEDLNKDQKRELAQWSTKDSWLGRFFLSRDRKNKVGIWAEVGQSGDVKTNKAQIKRVEAGAEELVTVALTQGCSDDAAHNLMIDVFQKNTYRMSYFRGDKRYQLGNCTFVRGWSFIMPYHFVQALFARRLPPNTIISFSQQMSEDLMQIPLSHFFSAGVDNFYLTDNCVRLPFKNGDFRDCVMVNLHSRMCTPHRDLVRHFILTSDQGKLKGSFSGAMATFHVNNMGLYRVYNWLNAVRPCDKKIEIFHPEDGFEYPEESYIQRDCYEYNAPTRTGDCGSIIGLYNKYLERKIIGMHIAGNDAEEHGYACPLTQECLETAFSALVNKNKKNISSQFYYEIPNMVDPLGDSSVPEGKFYALGKSSIRVGQAVNSSIIPSRIYGKLSVPTMKPALLKPTILNNKVHNPLLSGLKKCGVDTAVLSDDEVLSASQDVCRVMLNQYNKNLNKTKYQRILTYEEAIRGTQDDEFMCAINRTTSPGFPYAQMKRNAPGKQQWMGFGEEFDFTSNYALALRKDVEQLIEDCASGKISNVIFVDTLKDERRDIAKVNVGKTRVFSAGPQHFVVAFRQYFLPFAAWLMHNRISNEVAVGTNVYSSDWERIAKRLKTKGSHVIAGDFGNFDGSLVAQILWAIFWEIFVVWLKQFIDIENSEGKRILCICLGLWSHLVHSVHIYEDNVYMWTHSQPSGNPFTVIINCLYNSIIMRLSWIRVMEKFQPRLKSMKWFNEYVALITYGDDNVLNIDAKVVEWFNQINISEVMTEMRHEYTDEAKTGDIVKSRKLEDIFFLKRKFRFSPELQRHVAPLKIEVIYEMLNWSRRSIDPDEILMSNIETAFREVVYHGKEEYDKLRSAVLALKVPQELPENPQILTYNQYLHDIEYLADPLYDF
uniref:Replicase polyprotein n=3 Tax=Drosophila C virus TaxID=64279 RepID=A0A5P1NND8_9VIRU|nr:replicase polyprotein [Drosophila C virus]